MIPSQRHLFDIPDDVAYFNSAYMSPLSRAVIAAGEEGLHRKRQPWKVTPKDFFTGSEAARAGFANLIGATANDVAIVPSASYGMSLAARNLVLKTGRRVLVLDEQFPSNFFPWQQLAAENDGEILTIDRPADGDWTAAILAQLDERVGVVALPHCHWTDGGLIDLVAVGQRCREMNAALALDVTQSLGALPLDVKAIEPDYLVAACYKWLMGPYSVGFLYAAPHQQAGEPLEYNWIQRRNSEDFTALVNYQDDYQPGARRYDMGERSNFALIPAARAAFDQIAGWGVENIQSTLALRNAGIAKRALDLGLTSVDAKLRAGHFLGLTFADGVPEGFAEKLARNNVFVSVRGTRSMRITPHVYNTDADVDHLFEVLEATLG
jgi:selenocysteine lyase/cysteine desulfurase